MHFGMGVVVGRRLSSPSTSSWNLGTHFSAAPPLFVDLSPLEATLLPPTLLSSMFVPIPREHFPSSRLGQLGSSHGPVNALRVEGGGGR